MKELNKYHRYLIHEFVEDYKDGFMSRRDMMARVLHITGSVAATATVLTAMGVKAAGAQDATPVTSPPAGPQSPLSVPADDPAVIAEDITFDNAGETIMAYQAVPDAMAMEGTPVAGTPALVLVCHENRGLTEHIRDVVRRYAKAGYVACAVDLLSRDGGTAAITDQSQIGGLLSDADPMRHVSDFQAAVAFYQTQSVADAARIGMTGFCFGGGVTWNCATAIAELKAAAPYYGPPPSLDAVPNIQAAVLGVYSSDPDDFANQGRDELEAALQAAGITYQFNVYPDTRHAFHNDTSQAYNQEQAIAAWNDTLAWFEQYLV